MYLCILLLYYIFPEPNRQQYQSINQSIDHYLKIDILYIAVGQQTDIPFKTFLRPFFKVLFPRDHDQPAVQW